MYGPNSKMIGKRTDKEKVRFKVTQDWSIRTPKLEGTIDEIIADLRQLETELDAAGCENVKLYISSTGYGEDIESVAEYERWETDEEFKDRMADMERIEFNKAKREEKARIKREEKAAKIKKEELATLAKLKAKYENNVV